MGKRSDFERKPRDFYPTPIEAVYPLLEHLEENFLFAEPCAGDGALINHLEGIYAYNYDQLTSEELIEAEYIITNPPWDRKLLHPMIEFFTSKRKTWLLFDADWPHTKQSKNYISMCSKIVSVGRIKWFGNMTGKDNCAWYLFDKKNDEPTKFYGRI